MDDFVGPFGLEVPPAMAGSNLDRPPQPPTNGDTADAVTPSPVGVTTTHLSTGAESQAVRNGDTPSRRRQNSEARTSRFRGVQWDRNGARWRARLHTDRTRHIGYFDTEHEAAMAWDLAVLRYFGIEDGKKKLNLGDVSISRYLQEPDARQAAINSRISKGKSRAATKVPNGAISGRASGQDGEDSTATPGYRGVVPDAGGTYRAIVTRNRINMTVGVYESAEEAARAHDCATIEYNGWGSLTNYPLMDYEADASGKVSLVTAAKAIQRPPPHRQASLGLQSDALLHRSSSASLDLMVRSASVPNLHLLALNNPPPQWPLAGPPPSAFTLHSFPAFAAPSNRNPDAQMAGTAHPPAGLQGLGAQQQQHARSGAFSEHRKRPRESNNPSASGDPAQSDSSGDPMAASIERKGSGLGGQRHSGSTTHAFIQEKERKVLPPAVGGVCPQGDGQFRAVLYLDLGTFSSYDEASRVYDRACLWSSGLTGVTHRGPLADIIARAAQFPPQLFPAAPLQQTSPRSRGVIFRGGVYLVQLDLAGRPYELGPFVNEVDAAKAYDRYSMLLNGIRARTNYPPWEHLASGGEVSALIDAVTTSAEGHSLISKEETFVPGTALATVPIHAFQPQGPPVLQANSQFLMPNVTNAGHPVDAQHIQSQLDELQAAANGQPQPQQQLLLNQVATNAGVQMGQGFTTEVVPGQPRIAFAVQTPQTGSLPIFHLPVGHISLPAHSIVRNIGGGLETSALDGATLPVHASLTRIPPTANLPIPPVSFTAPTMMPNVSAAGTEPEANEGTTAAAGAALVAATQLEAQLAAAAGGPILGSLQVQVPLQMNPTQGAKPSVNAHTQHTQQVFVGASGMPSIAAFPTSVPMTTTNAPIPALSGGAVEMQSWGINTSATPLPTVPMTTPSELAAAAVQEAAAAIREVSTAMVSGEK